MRPKSVLLLGVFLLLAAFAFAQESAGVNIERAQIDDVDVYPESLNSVSFERGGELELEFHIRAVAAMKDVELEASIKGYEYSVDSPVRASLGPFDLDAGTLYIKKFSLKLPENLKEDTYRLRVRIQDRSSLDVSVDYNLKVDLPRHKLSIKDVILTPSGNVEAGRALLASVRVENKGEKDEDDVKVTVSVPDFGISASDYIEEIEYDEEEETEDLYLRLPECAEAGEHIVRVDVFFRKEQVSAATKINVIENEACKPAKPPVVVVQEDKSKPSAEVTVSEEVKEKPVASSKSRIRTALEIILLVLVGLLILVGLVIGFSRMKAEE